MCRHNELFGVVILRFSPEWEWNTGTPVRLTTCSSVPPACTDSAGFRRKELVPDLHRSRSVKKRGKRKRRRPRTDFQNVVIGPPDPSCPCCRGDMTVQEAIEAGVGVVEFISITLRGDATTWPHLEPEPAARMIPAGITAADLIALMSMIDVPRLLDDGPCRARINGTDVAPGYVLTDGDDVHVTRIRGPSPVSRKS